MNLVLLGSGSKALAALWPRLSVRDCSRRPCGRAVAPPCRTGSRCGPVQGEQPGFPACRVPSGALAPWGNWGWCSDCGCCGSPALSHWDSSFLPAPVKLQGPPCQLQAGGVGQTLPGCCETPPCSRLLCVPAPKCQDVRARRDLTGVPFGGHQAGPGLWGGGYAGRPGVPGQEVQNHPLF